MAAYRIDRSNIVQATGEVIGGVKQLAALGLVRSTGMELDLLADVTERWVVNRTYAYNDARVMDAGPNGITNAPATASPMRHATSSACGRATTCRRSTGHRLRRDHVGEVSAWMSRRSRAYTVFDMSWKTTWKQWQFQANVKTCSTRCARPAASSSATGISRASRGRVYVQAAYSF